MNSLKSNIETNQYRTAAYSLAHAFDPAASVFVSANAGAGKTSLLTNRVLALLLHGVAPSKLLCLTYTHAAASEMSGRILEKLGAWVMSDDAELTRQLSALTTTPPSKQKLIFARGLFAKVLEAPEGLRIQTIHSFCQSLLRRFPLEAAISPHFTLMDARTEQALLKEASLRLFNRAQDHDPVLQASLRSIAHLLSESSFQDLLAEIIKNKRRIRSLFSGAEGARQAEKTLWTLLGIPTGSTVSSFIEKYLHYDDETKTRLKAICSQLLEKPEPSNQDTGQGLAKWLEHGHSALQDYSDTYITDKGTKRKTLFTKNTLKNQEDIDLLHVEQQRVWDFVQARNALETAERSTTLLHIAEALLALYDALKSSHMLMDYDDLILTARDLLQKPGIAPWILYKLDGGIDHILVDEAQDTSPEQWDIIEALTSEFFSGTGRQTQDRSLFIVGDEKQSIYSFQGADPMALGRQTQYFSALINDAAKTLHTIQLEHSFRSTPEILSSVDAIFSQTAARSGLMFGSQTLTHIPTRTGYKGLVECWPLTPPLMEDEKITVSSKTMLARQIADTIRGWLDSGVMLESKNRHINAGDIMILVRKRTSLVDALVRALKRKNIAVAGHDRMALSDNLAVQDLIALSQCLLLPEDDLTLAAVLKSPIFGVSEETLFSLAWNRGKKSLWERLSEESSVDEAHALLRDLRARADFVSPYELYVYLLDSCGIRKRFIGRMGEEYHDAIDEFLGQALLYERSHTPSLQGFMSWLNAGDSEIKRDMEQAKDCIRIMTVHGAKGLQAPIVILPDTVDVPKPQDTLLWYEEDAGSLPLWPSSSKRSDAISTELREKQKQSILAEYRRLLYVALTRAEDRLYIGGAAAHHKLSEDSWYHLIEQGIKPLTTPFDTQRGQGMRVGLEPARQSERLPATTAPSVASKNNAHFAFLNHPAPIEPTPSQPLVPSRLALDEPASSSPVSARNANVFQRGKLIHHLLQYLPSAPPEQRESLATYMAATYRHTVSEPEISESIAEVMRIISDPQHSFLFSADALCEVPVAGCVTLEGKTFAVSGQIDRLVITPQEIWIIDYKSNRLPPQELKNIPAAYVKQMALYRLLLQQIYPDKAIICALLWTANASITTLDESHFSSYI